MPQPLPYETPPAEVAVRIHAQLRNPNVRSVTQAVLHSGPRVYRYATLYEIIDPLTQIHHHWCLRIDSVSRSKKTGWASKPDKSVLLESEGNDEIGELLTLLQAALSGKLPASTGEFHIVDAAGYAGIRQLLESARSGSADRKLRVVRGVLNNLDLESLTGESWIDLFESGPGLTGIIASAARIVQYRRELVELLRLIEDPHTVEGDLQRHLAHCPWMFGSEYSELLERRTWTRDDRLDFMLRRTVDDYFEILEIKTPFSQPLFSHDEGRDSYAAAKPLTAAVGQVIRYMEEMERGRDGIKARDGVDVLKVRARIILGRSGDTAQMQALHSFNGHLHRIEVLTFDQLVLIAKRVLKIMEGELAAETSGPSP